MLALDFIRQNIDDVRRAIEHKGVTIDLDSILTHDAKLRSARARLDALRTERNRLSSGERGTSASKAVPEDDRGTVLRAEIKALQQEVRDTQHRLDELLLWVPNLPSEGAPVGLNSSANTVVRREGRLPVFTYPAKTHIELIEQNGWADLTRVTKVCGTRTYCLRGRLALLEQALLWHASKRLASDGFTVLSVPGLARREAFVGSGHFPFGQDDAFELPRDRLLLAGTAEVVLNSLHAGEILQDNDLPLLYAGFSPCFRREAGSAGRDVRGLLRVHQFYKVEQFVMCRNDVEESAQWHARLLANAEGILRDLELPYQVVECSTGDMGVGKYRMNDIETWIPSLEQYRETHSCSTLHEWQARRTNVRYRDRSGHVRFVHTLNNTAIATPRILVPLLENHQRVDGRVQLPKSLRGYFDGDAWL
jgi:seryl-tRNA synthetase